MKPPNTMPIEEAAECIRELGLPWHRVGLACLIAICLWPTAASAAYPAAEAGTRPQGAGLVEVGGGLLLGAQAFDLQGDAFDSPDYRLLRLRYAFEYGLTDQWTLVSAGSPVGNAAMADESQLVSGPIDLGLRRALFEGIEPVYLSVEARYGVAPGVGSEDLAPQADPSSFIASRQTHLGQLEVRGDHLLSIGPSDLGLDVRSTLRLGTRIFSADSLAPTVFASFEWSVLSQTVLEGLETSVALSAEIPLDDLNTANVAPLAGQRQHLSVGLDVQYWFSDNWAMGASAERAMEGKSGPFAPEVIVSGKHRW